MRRREFITLLGCGAAAWPLAAHAQQPALPVIGFLSLTPQQPAAHLVRAVQGGLAEAGYVETQNLSIEYRWADDQYGRLPELAADLVRRRVPVIVAFNSPAALAAKRATSTIPIVFSSALDPVASGLVESFNRPGGNTTGMYILITSLEVKRLEILHQVLPNATTIGVLTNPRFSGAERQLADLHEGSRRLGVELLILKATSEGEFANVFATLVDRRIKALLVAADPVLYSLRDQLVALTARHSIPAVYDSPEFALAGGLMSYGADLMEAYRQLGVYTGRILKGERSADLPVQQSTKVELVINLKTAKALGIEVPLPLLGRADQVIE
jgi:putative ABC transport system substrate-binding protein